MATPWKPKGICRGHTQSTLNGEDMVQATRDENRSGKLNHRLKVQVLLGRLIYLKQIHSLMSQDWIEKAINDMEEYFENASDDQIEEDLKEARYEYYKNVEYTSILSFPVGEN